MEEQIKQLQEQVKELQTAKKELSDAKEQLKESSQFIEDASILVSAIMKDSDLKTRVQKSIAGEPDPEPKKEPAPPDGQKDWKFDPLTGKPLKEPEKPVAPAKDER